MYFSVHILKSHIKIFNSFKVKFYEALSPLKIQCSALQNRIELYAMEMNDKEDEIAKTIKV